VTRSFVVATLVAAVAFSLPVLGQQSAGAAASARPANAPAWFVDVAAVAGVTFHHVNGASPERHLHEIMSGGGLFFDYDNDGWLDIFLVDGGSLTDPSVAARARHRLFHNRGNGTFEDRTTASGIVHRSYGMGACSADYDNDGFVDLYVTAMGGNALYRNVAGKSFVDVTKTAGVSWASFSSSCAFGDVDRDGDVDLFVVNYVDARLDNNIFCGNAPKRMRIYCHPLNFKPLASMLYQNNGNGTFTDVSASTGIGSHRGNGLGVVMGDYDDDGWLDVFVANDTTPNFLFRNDGKGRFSEVALRSGVAMASDGRARAGMGTDFGDVDGDGDLDLFVTNHELETHTLYRNLGKGLFSEVTAEARLSTPTLPFVGFGTAFVDHDNDGDLDIGIVNGHVVNIPTLVRPGATLEQLKLLFVNDGRGRMREIGRQAGPGFANERVGRTFVAGDIDNDGDLDFLVTNNGGDAELLRNELTSTAGAVSLRLIGTTGNRSAVGARIRVSAGDRTLLREVKAGSSYLGQNDLRQHIGLGSITRLEKIEIRWPNGTVEMVADVAPGELVTVTEGKGVTARSPFAASGRR
jgi:enediyne biosynthesis protein E4